jgi:hypothetical protein
MLVCLFFNQDSVTLKCSGLNTFSNNNSCSCDPRLWSAKSPLHFDLKVFNTGDYIQVSLYLHRCKYWKISPMPPVGVAAYVIPGEGGG